MVYDSIANASIPTAASNSKDFAKKKRVNRTAKLKQSKLDVRREQWLSQVKNKGLGLKEGTNVTKVAVSETHATVKERDHEMVKLEINVGGGGEENEGLMNQYSDSESNSPTSHTSSVSGSNSSGTNFTVSSGMSSSGSSSSRGSNGCVSENMTDEEDGRNNDDDDDCLDDWEAMADALEADEIKKDGNDDGDGDANLEPPVHETEHESEPVLTQARARASFRAWRPDDVSRPQCLPNLLKQHSFPMKSGMHNCVGFAPSSCPICCEDLDMTDSSFLPCPCGYRLCLFCHKRILEDNGRCPGCRKPYEQPDQKNAPIKVARCYSMNQMH
ncbi:uncharacterized protein [Rutidosis leptorrhynchoides]|uniref:uncharacterized protein n=1 Tax=Rutidosis leptorrhynchoides TaxID=125765 RepID=UPI003A99B4DC